MSDGRTYPTAVDAWIGAILVGTAVVAAVSIGAAFLVADLGTGVVLVITGLLLVLLLVGLAWPIRYTFGEDHLLIRSGALLRFRVPLADITAVTPTRAAWSSPALSMNRLRVEAGRSQVLISPQDRSDFLAELQLRAPQLRPTDEGGLAR